jgi:hypothetical protein
MTLRFLKSRWKSSNKINKGQVTFIINNQTPVCNQELQASFKFTNTESSQHQCFFCNLHKFQLNTNMTVLRITQIRICLIGVPEFMNKVILNKTLKSNVDV